MSSHSGNTYYSIQPATLSVPSLWKYRDLQKLCKQLGLSAAGKRDELVERLQAWHVDGRHGDNAECGRFGLIGVNLHSKSPNGTYKSKVSPGLLSPFKRRKRERRADGRLASPRSILKARCCPLSGLKSPGAKAPSTPRPKTPSTNKKKRARLVFSPYNMVRVISPRLRS
jgi:hypothetical protein